MFFYCFLIINLYFLIATVLGKIFSPFPELLMAMVIPTNEAKAEIKTKPVISKPKIGG